MKFGLTDKQENSIAVLLRKAQVTKATIFGSRAKGDHLPNSDIDIAVWGNELNIGKILTELDELSTPYKFDVVAYENISTDALREHIDRVGITLFKEANENDQP